MAQWYWKKDGQKHGPIDTAGLKQLARNGQLRPDDMIWRDGLPSWVPASQVNGLEFNSSHSVQNTNPSPVAATAAVYESHDSGGFLHRIPKFVWASATILFAILLSISVWLALRDTWERDNRATVADMCHETKSLLNEGKLQEGVSKYGELKAFIANRQLRDKDLRTALSETDIAAKRANSALEKDQDRQRVVAETLNTLANIEAQAIGFVKNGDYDRGITKYQQILDAVAKASIGDDRITAYIGRATAAVRDAETKRVALQQKQREEEQRQKELEVARIAGVQSRPTPNQPPPALDPVALMKAHSSSLATFMKGKTYSSKWKLDGQATAEFISIEVTDVDVEKTSSLTKPYAGQCVLFTVQQRSWVDRRTNMKYRLSFYMQDEKWILSTVEYFVINHWSDVYKDDPIGEGGMWTQIFADYKPSK